MPTWYEYEYEVERMEDAMKEEEKRKLEQPCPYCGFFVKQRWKMRRHIRSCYRRLTRKRFLQ